MRPSRTGFVVNSLVQASVASLEAKQMSKTNLTIENTCRRGFQDGSEITEECEIVETRRFIHRERKKQSLAESVDCRGKTSRRQLWSLIFSTSGWKSLKDRRQRQVNSIASKLGEKCACVSGVNKPGVGCFLVFSENSHLATAASGTSCFTWAPLGGRGDWRRFGLLPRFCRSAFKASRSTAA